jgi:transposase
MPLPDQPNPTPPVLVDGGIFDNLEAIDHLLKAGKSVASIARFLNINHETARRHLIQSGIYQTHRRSIGRYADQILAMRQQGLSVPAIAKSLGIWNNRIYAYLAETNLAPAKSPPITKAMAKQMTSLYQDGMSLREIAERMEGISSTRIGKVLRQRGVKLRRSGRPANKTAPPASARTLTKREIADAARLYDQGLGCVRLAAIFKTTEPAMRKALTQAGVTMRKPGDYRKLSDEAKQQVLKLHREGWTAMAIAEQFDVTAPVITKLLKAAGEKSSRRGPRSKNHESNTQTP